MHNCHYVVAKQENLNPALWKIWHGKMLEVKWEWEHTSESRKLQDLEEVQVINGRTIQLL